MVAVKLIPVADELDTLTMPVTLLASEAAII